MKKIRYELLNNDERILKSIDGSAFMTLTKTVLFAIGVFALFPI